MAFFINIVNQVLFFAYDVINQIFGAFGLSWIGVVVGLAVISTILRLFASNLIGTALNIHHERQEAAVQQRIEQQKARISSGRGAASSSRLKPSDYDFSRSSAVRDHFIKHSRRG